jgi:hypothetical protein
MTAICEVIEEVTESFQGKRGKVDLRLLVCLDRTPAGKLRNTFDYVLTEDEYKKHNGKAAGQTAQLAITDIEKTFAGRLRCHGSVLQLGPAKA